MASAHDVAKYIIENHGPMSAMKLQKLVYYSQAWSLVWDERPIFHEPIEAWIGGPVVRALYDVHQGQYDVKSWRRGSINNLDKDAKETIDVVIKDYGSKSGQYLSDLTHSERPWIDARRGLKDDERGNATISIDTMREFYTDLHNRAYG